MSEQEDCPITQIEMGGGATELSGMYSSNAVGGGEARRIAVCKLELRSGGTSIPWPDGGSVELPHPAGKVEPAYLGFLPPEPVSVYLVPGEERTLVVELSRR